MHKFRFGVLNTGSSLDEWQTFARKAEDMGFSTLVVQDHFAMKHLAPLPALMAAAAVTKHIRLGTIVLDNDFRHPALLAKEAATVDVLTGGRFELGIGAGWTGGDYQQTGIPFDAAGVRVERLMETVRICKAFFTEETVTFEGKHYHLDKLDAFPKPTHKPHPPIMVGGRQKRMLQLAAREADIVSISLLDRLILGLANPPTFAEKVGWVREAAGTRLDHIEIHINASNMIVSDNPQATLDELATRQQTTPEALLNSPAVLVGSPDAIVDRLHQLREQFGVSYFCVNQRVMDNVAPVVAKAVGK
jgi:probable F420-dependent oxidoreductase